MILSVSFPYVITGLSARIKAASHAKNIAITKECSRIRPPRADSNLFTAKAFSQMDCRRDGRHCCGNLFAPDHFCF